MKKKRIKNKRPVAINTEKSHFFSEHIIGSLKFTKRRRETKRCFNQPQQKLKRFPFSSNIKFSSQFSRFRQIPLLNFTKRRKATKTGLHSAATKTETIPIFFTIFSLSSDCSTKLHKTPKNNKKRISVSCNKD